MGRCHLCPEGEVKKRKKAKVATLRHGTGNCRTCAWFWRPSGCNNGEACRHCHLCPAGELKARKKSKVQAMQTIRQQKQQREAEEDDLASEGEEPLPMMPPGMLPPNLLLAMLPPHIVPPMLPSPMLPAGLPAAATAVADVAGLHMLDVRGWTGICW